MFNTMDLIRRRTIYNSADDTQNDQNVPFYGWYFNDKSVRTEQLDLDVMVDDIIYHGERGFRVTNINYLPTHLHIQGDKLL